MKHANTQSPDKTYESPPSTAHGKDRNSKMKNFDKTIHEHNWKAKEEEYDPEQILSDEKFRIKITKAIEAPLEKLKN